MVVQREESNKSKVIKPVSETRKVRKPLMERKRRERINNSLEQLANLLKDADLVAKDKPIAKMEKADILELTVQHIRGVRRQNPFNATAERSFGDPIAADSAKDQNNVKFIIPNENSSFGENQDLIDTQSSEDSKLIIDESSNSNDRLEQTSPNTDDSYVQGFYKCLNEVKLVTKEKSDFKLIENKLLNHLKSCMKDFTSKFKQSNDTTEKRTGVKREFKEINDCSSEEKSKKTKVQKVVDSTIQKDSNSSAGQGLTLVPMRLADGAVAYLLQGETQLVAPETNKPNDNVRRVSREAYQTKYQSNFEQKTNAVHNDINLSKLTPNKLPIPALCRKPPTFSKKPAHLNLETKHLQVSPLQNCYEADSKNTVLYSKLQDKNIVEINKCNGSQYSFHINGAQGIISSSKIIPKVKTVTLPVGTVASTINSSNSSCTDSKSTTVISSMSLPINSTSTTTTIDTKPAITIESFQNLSLPSSYCNYINLVPRTKTIHSETSPINRKSVIKQAPDQSVAISIPERPVFESNITSHQSVIQNVPITSAAPNICQSQFYNSKPLSLTIDTPTTAGSDKLPRRESTSFSSSSRVNNQIITIYPPTPPPSVPICTDQWGASSPGQSFTPSTQHTLTVLSSPIESYSSSDVLLATNNNCPLQSNNGPPQSNLFSRCPSSSMSLVSTSVQLLSPDYCNDHQRVDEQGEDEFIDVENDLNDVPECSSRSVYNKDLSLQYRQDDEDEFIGDMWRPW